MSTDILDLIDNAITDSSTSPDAMRWTADAPTKQRVASGEQLRRDIQGIFLCLEPGLRAMAQAVATFLGQLRPLLKQRAAQKPEPEWNRKHHAHPKPLMVRSKLRRHR